MAHGYRSLKLNAAVIALTLALHCGHALAQTKPTAPTAWPAVDGLLNAFKSYRLVGIGDAHGLAQELDFYAAVVRDPRLAGEVGNVVVEFGGSGQKPMTPIQIKALLRGTTISIIYPEIVAPLSIETFCRTGEWSSPRSMGRATGTYEIRASAVCVKQPGRRELCRTVYSKGRDRFIDDEDFAATQQVPRQIEITQLNAC